VPINNTPWLLLYAHHCRRAAQDAAKKAEAQVREAATSAQARALDLTRARAELLAARDQLTALQSQLDAVMASSPALFKPNGPLGEVAGLRELMASGDVEYGELSAAAVGAAAAPHDPSKLLLAGGGGVNAGMTGSGSAEGVWGQALLARLRAAQGLRKEAEVRAEALQRSLAAAEAQQLSVTVSGEWVGGWAGGGGRGSEQQLCHCLFHILDSRSGNACTCMTSGVDPWLGGWVGGLDIPCAVHADRSS
jgi:hypothetical protein